MFKHVIVNKKLRLCLVLICAEILSPFVYAANSVVFAIDIVRHGDRTPTVAIPNSPYNWQDEMGELTATGMHQEFILGKYLRETYVNQYNLLLNKYKSNTIYVRSSDFDRTLMSAQSILLGLYPLGTGLLLPNQKTPALPGLFQPVPIHTIPQNQDSLLIPGQNQPEFKPLIAKYVFASARWQKKSTMYQAQFQRWSAITGMPIKKLYQIIPLGDNLYVRMLHNVPMPKGITNQDRDEIISLANWAITAIFNPYEVSSYASKDLRLDIAKYLKEANLSKSDLKYVLFSAHDSTLLAIMSALNLPLESEPSYASDLNILLIKNDSDNNYYVKLSFNKHVIKLKNCAINCPLADFMKYLN